MIFEAQGQLFFLILARVTAIVITVPFFSSSSIPAMARGGLILFLSVAIYPMLGDYIAPTDSTNVFILRLGMEVLVGLLLGLLVQLIFTIFQMAGQFFSLQMGFSASQVFDATAQAEIPIMGQFFNTIALMIFFVTSAMHKFVFIGIAKSFTSLALAGTLMRNQEHIITVILTTVTSLFEQALLIALPIIGTLFLLSTVMGMLAKAAPQMNLLILGFPIQIGLGFLIMFLSMPLIMTKMSHLINSGIDQLQVLLNSGGSL